MVYEGEFESVKQFKIYHSSLLEKESETSKSILKGKSVPNLVANKQQKSQKSYLRKK